VVGAEPLDLAWIGLARGDQLPNLDEEPLDPAGHISVHAPGGSVGSIRERVHDAGRDEDERAGLGVERLLAGAKAQRPLDHEERLLVLAVEVSEPTPSKPPGRGIKGCSL
jgi:hypothetical protein